MKTGCTGLAAAWRVTAAAAPAWAAGAQTRRLGAEAERISRRVNGHRVPVTDCLQP